MIVRQLLDWAGLELNIKRSHNVRMKPFILICLYVLTVFICIKAQATTFTVKKSKGFSAVIESSEPLAEGETYVLQSRKKVKNQSRDNSFSLGLDSSFFKSGNIQENQITLEGRYGWSSVDYEFGPLLKINLYDEGAGFNSEYSVGGYFDYNLVANTVAEEYVYGLTAQAVGGNREFTTGSSSQVLIFGGGGFLSWYLLGTSTALRAEALVEQKQISTASTSTSVTGFAGKMLLAFYF